MAHAWCFTYAAAAAKSLQSCLTLYNPIDGSPPGPAIPGILQARTLEWVAISFSNAWKWKVKVESLSRVRLLATPWTIKPTRLLGPRDFPGKSTGVGCHCLLSLSQTHLEIWILIRIPFPIIRIISKDLRQRISCQWLFSRVEVGKLLL